MSDISEHDSDSDTEVAKIPNITTPANQQQLTGDVVTDYLLTTYTSHDEEIAVDKNNGEFSEGTGDIVSELRMQAVEPMNDASKPEWQQYLEQSQDSGAYTYTDPNDGTVYQWDEEKRAWFPKIDEDFLAMYQANYGFTESGEHNPMRHLETANESDGSKDTEKTNKKTKDDAKKVEDKKEAKKRKNDDNGWFDMEDPKSNTNVYVTGLPVTTTEQDFNALMSKYGIVALDDAGDAKFKLYKDSSGQFKGDARCCYLKYESLVLACEMLDKSEYNGNTITCEQAVFELKGTYNPALKPKKKKSKKKKGKGQEKLLDWVDRAEKRSKFDRIAILKHMFDYKEFEKDPTLINEIKIDLKSECEKFGEVKKVLIFDRNTDGVCSVLFKEADFADKCIEGLNGRYYAGQVISAATFDGVTNYQVKETEEQMEKRLTEWERFIENDDEDNTSNAKTELADAIISNSDIESNAVLPEVNSTDGDNSEPVAESCAVLKENSSLHASDKSEPSAESSFLPSEVTIAHVADNDESSPEATTEQS